MQGNVSCRYVMGQPATHSRKHALQSRFLRPDLGDAALSKATFEAGNGDAELVVASLSLCWRESAEADVVAVLLCIVVPQRYLHQVETIRPALSEYTLIYDTSKVHAPGRGMSSA